jgi:hypothetical protein
MPGRFRRPRAHAIAARARVSIHRPLRPGERGGSRGRGRERGALTEGAVVATLTAIFVEQMPGFNVLGEAVHVASEGAPVQVKVTLWLNPPSPATLKE